MIISVASGKGGTGKTTIATGLAAALTNKGEDVTYLDCDVEEPNGHIFLKPEISRRKPVPVLVPNVDRQKCSFCGVCSDVCQYNAIAVLQDRVLVFPSLCHSCGCCRWMCPEQAIEETERNIGQLRGGLGHGVKFWEGRLNVGEALSPPVTKALRQTTPKSEIMIIDAPPGTSCPVIEAVNGTDFVILVTEPTPFGLNDLRLATGMVRELGIPFGVVINRSDIGNDDVEDYCKFEEIDVLMRIPFERSIAEAYSRGETTSNMSMNFSANLCEMYETIKSKVYDDGTGNSKR